MKEKEYQTEEFNKMLIEVFKTQKRELPNFLTKRHEENHIKVMNKIEISKTLEVDWDTEIQQQLKNATRE
ncbi:hypothetical protein [Seonamhaeicola maritimus]|uniref:hypothetical protein n=1 Tax=Seonamhaeicola maritimus TaxID=2591822 RepID=UPI0024954351|nr:hypothetical protein [Seonamhaeicola maritimus]